MNCNTLKRLELKAFIVSIPNKTDIVNRMGMRSFLRSPLVETRFIASCIFPFCPFCKFIQIQEMRSP
ncbi:MAG: hypothetical protein V7L19_29305 [Nostoc sp.]|uniref:hypothetical protein n=1 Tax=Nostoc sp. TaxID=1180 RepID=UPI002FF813C4